MFKKAFQIVVTLGLLIGAYQGYLVGFTVLTESVSNRRSRELLKFVPHESRTGREATRFAVESLGPSSFAASKDLRIRYYDAERGYYIYAREYVRLDNGKKFRFEPFACIWISKDGKSRKVATSDRALIELSEPLGLLKPAGSEGMHVIEARLEGNVVLRDDKGTIADRADDLVVSSKDGPLPYIEYTEKTDPPEIRSVSDIKLVDRDMRVTGFDLLIQLRKQEMGGGGGFEAQTAILQKDVDIAVQNVGKAGVLPGTAQGTKGAASTPLTLKSAGRMRIDFPVKPKPLRPGQDGPPEPEGPTVATFSRNVEVVRGLVDLDVLNCDTLILNLVPAEKQISYAPILGGASVVFGTAAIVPDAGGMTPRYAKAGDGPMTDLTLREANAKGFAVWLRSTAQGMTARCNELIYKKLMPTMPDETYLRADSTKELYVEKVDREPATGAIKSVSMLWALDAKVFDDGKGGSASTIVARGPGRLEIRPDRDKSREQSATWQSDLVMLTTPIEPDTRLETAPSSNEPPSKPKTKRKITLTGFPTMVEHVKLVKLDADAVIVIDMLPKPELKEVDKPAGEKAKVVSAAPAVGGPLASGSYRIERLVARENVRLTAPGKTVIARDALEAPFEDVVALASAPSPKETETKETKTAPPAGVLASATPVPAPAAAAEGEKKPAAEDEAAKPPPEPNQLVKGNRIWALIRQGADGKSEIAEARLRGGVSFHEDPSPDKPIGTNVTGEALDLKTLGKGRMKFHVSVDNPEAQEARARLAALGTPRPAPALATIDTDDYSIRGPAIGLDQSRDFFWVEGPGSMTQLAERGFLTDKGVQQHKKAIALMTEAEQKAEAKKNQPLTIDWKDRMRFYGRTVDLQGRPAAKAEFFGSVRARSEDALILAEELDTYTDGPVSLVQPRRTSPTTVVAEPVRGDSRTRLIDDVLPVAVNRDDVPEAGSEPKPKPQLAFMDARSKPRKAAVPRSGDDPDDGWMKPKADAIPPVVVVSVRRDPLSFERIEQQRIEGERVRYDKRSGDYLVNDFVEFAKGQVWIWRRGVVKEDPAGPARKLDKEKRAQKPKVFGGWEVTQIEFNKVMRGRFGIAKDTEESEPRTADFYGSPKVLNVPVDVDGRKVSFDARKSGRKYLTSDMLRLIDIPPPPGVKDVPSRTLMTADGGAQGRDDTHNISGDWMTYDSEKGLFYAYGEGGRLASITDQKNPGQPYSNARGSAVKYNMKDKSAQVIDPTTVVLIDGQGTARPVKEDAPGPPAAKPKPKRPGLRPPPLSNMERKDFTGG